MKKKGQERIALACSILLSLGWVIMVYNESGGFSNVTFRAKVIVLLIGIILFFLPVFLLKLFIKFRKNKM